MGRYIFPSPTSGVTGISPELVATAVEWEMQGLGVDDLKPTKSRRSLNERSQTPSKEVAKGFYEDLRTVDPIELDRRIMARMFDVDASNWEEVLDQFANITRDTGRTHAQWWGRMLIRVGQVAGEPALNSWLEKGLKEHETQAQAALYGWAMTDPKRAQDWFLNMGEVDEGMRLGLLSWVVGGISLKNPELLTGFVALLPEEDQIRTVGHSVWNLMQAGGIERTSAWVDEIQNGDWSPAIKKRSFDEVTKAVSKSVSSGAGVESSAKWFQDHRDSEFMTAGWIGSAAERHRLDFSVKGLDFLRETVDFPAMAGLESSPPGLAAVISNAFNHDPVMVESWLLENGSVPFRNQAIEQFASILESQGKVAKADEWRTRLGE